MASQDEISETEAELSTIQQVAGETFTGAWATAVTAAAIEYFQMADLSSAGTLIDGYQQEKIAADELGLPSPTKHPFVARVYALYANPGA